MHAFKYPIVYTKLAKFLTTTELACVAILSGIKRSVIRLWSRIYKVKRFQRTLCLETCS